ncbi:hypothetical protein R1flu_026582 [Riccia fluitans]|uniref:Uncharacterized protein n=1 Tax=Riccia fluitans TaxID=41844 RepID=A0ABD1XGY7_9MARC
MTSKTMHISSGGSQEYAASIGPSAKRIRSIASIPSIEYNLHAEPLAMNSIKNMEVPKDINPIEHGLSNGKDDIQYYMRAEDFKQVDKVWAKAYFELGLPFNVFNHP